MHYRYNLVLGTGSALKVSDAVSKTNVFDTVSLWVPEINNRQGHVDIGVKADRG